MTTSEIIETVLAGGLLGLLGQGIRMAIGLKKLSDSNSQQPSGSREDINVSRLIISLFLGFVAGALFLLVNHEGDLNNTEFIFAVIAAGYAGTDFIEGLFNTYLNKPANGPVPPGPTPQQPEPNPPLVEEENNSPKIQV